MKTTKCSANIMYIPVKNRTGVFLKSNHKPYRFKPPYVVSNLYIS